MGAKKLDVFVEARFIEEALRDGRATKQEVSMKAIGKPDHRTQARVVPLNIDHCRTLSAILKEQGNLGRIVLYFDQKVKRYWVADGFHRHECYRLTRLDSIPAYVIEGTMEEAVEYAVMCNRQAMLHRTVGDIKKAIMMLLEMPKWRERSSRSIADHVGCSGGTAERYATEYFNAHSLDRPQFRVNSSGDKRKIRRSTLLSDGPRVTTTRCGRQAVWLKGKRADLGYDPIAAEAMASQMVVDLKTRHNRLSASHCQQKIIHRGVSPTVNTYSDRRGVRESYRLARTVLFVAVSLERAIDFDWKAGFSEMVGRAVLARQHANHTGRTAIVCYREDLDPELATLAEAIGIELLSPDELVAAVTAEV